MNGRLPLVLSIFYHHEGKASRLKIRCRLKSDRELIVSMLQPMVRTRPFREPYHLLSVLERKCANNKFWAFRKLTLRVPSRSPRQLSRLLRRVSLLVVQAAFFQLREFALVSIQTEALDTAESLAALNVECLAVIDELPIKVAVRTLSHMIDVINLKHKCSAMLQFSRN